MCVQYTLPSEDDFVGATFYTVAETPTRTRLTLRCQTGREWDIFGDRLGGVVSVVDHAASPAELRGQAYAMIRTYTDDVAAAILVVLDIVEHAVGQMDYLHTICQILRTAEENT